MSPSDKLRIHSNNLRIEIIEMIYNAGSGHSGGSLSCAEILTVLYEEIMDVRPKQPDWPLRDRLILSKGHAAPALYAALALKGYFDPLMLRTLRQFESCLQGHPCMFKLPGVEMSTGSLGLGISAGVGMALSARLKDQGWRVFVLCGDGELQEGQNWEALMSAAKWDLGNLCVIIDHNDVQLDGKTCDIMPLGDLESKISAFGLNTVKCDGHDVDSLLDGFRQCAASCAPSALIASTVKGKGVSFMEGRSEWHGRKIERDQYESALNELRENMK